MGPRIVNMIMNPNHHHHHQQHNGHQHQQHRRHHSMPQLWAGGRDACVHGAEAMGPGEAEWQESSHRKQPSTQSPYTYWGLSHQEGRFHERPANY